MDKKYKINREIKADKVFLLSEIQESEVLPFSVALRRAEDENVDLVQVGQRADNVPVCKLVDYNRLVYQENKRKHKQEVKNKALSLKTLVFRPVTGANDFDLKIKHANEFLQKGHKVKIILKFKSRESTLKEYNQSILDKIVESLEEVAELDSKMSYSFKEVNFILRPKK